MNSLQAVLPGRDIIVPSIHFKSVGLTRNRHRIVIISDCHFPRRDSHPKYLYEFLLNNPSDTLIILGDFFEGYDKELGKFNEWHLRCLDLINYRKAKEGLQVVMMPGNHDQFLRDDDILNHALEGTAFVADMILRGHGGQDTFLIHGDCFDSEWRQENDLRLYRLAQKFNIASISLLAVYNRGMKSKLFRNFVEAGLNETPGKLVQQKIELIEANDCNALESGHSHNPYTFRPLGGDGSMLDGNSGAFSGGQATAEVLTRGDEWRLMDWRLKRKEKGMLLLPRKSDPNPFAEFREQSLRGVAFHRNQHAVWISGAVNAKTSRFVRDISELPSKAQDFHQRIKQKFQGQIRGLSPIKSLEIQNSGFAELVLAAA